MINEFFNVCNICVILVVGWAAFAYVSKHKLNYIKDYKKVSVVFLLGTLAFILLYFRYLGQFFVTFSFIPFLILIVFYFLIIFIYRYLRPHRNKALIQKNEAKGLYFTSMENNYLISKSFNILFQQVGILCVVAFLKNLGIQTILIMIIFAILFGVSHIYLYVKNLSSMIAEIFIPASIVSGLLFPPMVLTIQYGIIYTYSIHWSFYIILGALLQYNANRTSPKN